MGRDLPNLQFCGFWHCPQNPWGRGETLPSGSSPGWGSRGWGGGATHLKGCWKDSCHLHPSPLADCKGCLSCGSTPLYQSWVRDGTAWWTALEVNLWQGSGPHDRHPMQPISNERCSPWGPSANKRHGGWGTCCPLPMKWLFGPMFCPGNN